MAMKVFAKYTAGVDKMYGLVYLDEESCYYGLPEDIDDAANFNKEIRRALEAGNIEYVEY